MTRRLEKSYKNNHALHVFFDRNDVKIHNLNEYFRDKGIISFANIRSPLALFASNFIYGVESQEDLKKYVGIKAFPTLSGILLTNKDNISLNVLKEYFSSKVNQEFENQKNAILNTPKIGRKKLTGTIEYITVNAPGKALFEIITRDIEFEINSIKGAFIISTLLKKENDYKIILGIVKEIIDKDRRFGFKVIEHNLDAFVTTKKKNKFFLEIIKEVDPKYEFLGIIKFTRTPAEDLNNSTDAFESLLGEGTLETKKLTNIEALIEHLTSRNARLKGAGLVFKDRNINHIYIINLDSNEAKKRIEIGFNSDVKRISDTDEKIETFTCKADFDKLESVPLSRDKKFEIIKSIWKIIASKYLELHNEKDEVTLNDFIDVQNDSSSSMRDPYIEFRIKSSKDVIDCQKHILLLQPKFKRTTVTNVNEINFKIG